MAQSNPARALRERSEGPGQRAPVGLGVTKKQAWGVRPPAERFVWPRRPGLGVDNAGPGLGVVPTRCACEGAQPAAAACCGSSAPPVSDGRCNDAQPYRGDPDTDLGLNTQELVWTRSSSSSMPSVLQPRVGKTTLGLGRVPSGPGLGGPSTARFVSSGSASLEGLGTPSSVDEGGVGRPFAPAIGGKGSVARIQLPDFDQVSLATQMCFAEKYRETGWPETGVLAPAVKERTDCEPPSDSQIAAAIGAVGPKGYDWDKTINGASATNGLNVAPTYGDVVLFGSIVAFLQENRDLVGWAGGLVQSWSPEMEGLDLSGALVTLLTPDASGDLPFGVTYVESALDREGLPEGKATGWAFTFAKPTKCGQVGVIIPVRREDQDWMKYWLPAMGEGGGKALCAVATASTMVLHELVHVVADNWSHFDFKRTSSPTSWDGDPANMLGSNHEQDDEPFLFDEEGVRTTEPDPTYVRYPCWDECRMVSSLWQWALSQRYPCLIQGEEVTTPSEPLYVSVGCEDLGNVQRVALSYHPR